MASALITLGLFTWALASGRPLAEAMTMTFADARADRVLQGVQLPLRPELLLEGPFANKWLNLAIVWELVMLALVINVPFLQDAFGTTSLSVEEWLRVAGIAFLIVPVLEAAKWLFRRRLARGPAARLTAAAAQRSIMPTSLRFGRCGDGVDPDPRAGVVDVALRVPQRRLVLGLRGRRGVPGADEDLVRRRARGRP